MSYQVVRPFKFYGVQQERGAKFASGGADPRRLQQLLETRFLVIMDDEEEPKRSVGRPKGSKTSVGKKKVIKTKVAKKKVSKKGPRGNPAPRPVEEPSEEPSEEPTEDATDAVAPAAAQADADAEDDGDSKSKET
jgi:hypothetical protein